MLSFIYRLVKQFESGHGYRPNLLEISPEHFSLLRQSLPLLSQRDELNRFLGMRILFSRDAVHPRVAWSAVAEVESA
jgi:hypothetical protein